MRFLVILIAASVIVLSGCSSNPVIKHKGLDQTTHATLATWQKHKKILSHLQKWQFSGRFGAKTDTENWTGSIVWAQDNEQYKISITGPLSTGSIMLEGGENYALLWLSDENSYSDNDPQLLLQNHTGLKLPVNELRYWLLGLPAPHNEYSNMELNEKGLLSKLSQNNWEVKFKRYTTVNNLQLPDKVFLVNHEINVRLIIQKWQKLS